MNKVKKMLYSQKVAPYIFLLPFVIQPSGILVISAHQWYCMSFQDISFWAVLSGLV